MGPPRRAAKQMTAPARVQKDFRIREKSPLPILSNNKEIAAALSVNATQASGIPKNHNKESSLFILAKGICV